MIALLSSIPINNQKKGPGFSSAGPNEGEGEVVCFQRL